jgi:hypothetical protein
VLYVAEGIVKYMWYNVWPFSIRPVVSFVMKCMPLRKRKEGTQWRRWLRRCATRLKVAGSIPDGVTKFCYGLSPSGRTVTLGLTQPVTEMGTRGTSWQPY